MTYRRPCLKLNMYMNRQHIGRDLSERLLESRELLAFREVLDHKTSQNACIGDRVFTEIVDI